jgi:hypothetical protein
MKNCSIGWKIVKMDEYTHYNLESIVFGVFGVVIKHLVVYWV